MSTTPPSQPHHHDEDALYAQEDTSELHDTPEERWTALAKIVRDVGPNLSPDEELGDLAAAEAAVNAKDAERNAILDKIRDDLRQLSRQLNQAASAAQRPPSHPSPEEHDAHVRSLEQQQYSTGKQLNDEQAAVAKKEVELGKWKASKEEIGKVEIGEDAESWADGKVIRLKLFSEAGFSLVPPREGSSTSKILIRNDAKDDVHSVVVDNSRSKVYTANLIWNLASE
ncbi:hypothetical protein I350_06882 [Cryptococcus amylolentus CBS 6273]|uniref:Kinetochore protein Spc24 n=1 Tax=Cryptococcus amylolentus CBS 6273 TaxID=1296118 RepID=A0A1E3JHE0_9TREE|nr:hypothetical protein I350_06882 [Cryptococcus amylolentus CBS 6273]